MATLRTARDIDLVIAQAVDRLEQAGAKVIKCVWHFPWDLSS